VRGEFLDVALRGAAELDRVVHAAEHTGGLSAAERSSRNRISPALKSTSFRKWRLRRLYTPPASGECRAER
jgi:hypothetical protein